MEEEKTGRREKGRKGGVNGRGETEEKSYLYLQGKGSLIKRKAIE